MTMIVAAVTPQLALVAVDSIAADAAGAPCHWSKLSIIAAASVVIVTRGSYRWTEIFVSNASALRSFDEITDAAPRLVAGAYAMELRQRMIPKGPGYGGGLEVLIVGPSPRCRGRLSGALARHSASGPSFAWLNGRTCLRPWPHGYRAPQSFGDCTSPDFILAAARQQAAYTRAEWPSIPCGGDLVLATIEPQKITTETICRDL